MTVSFWVLIPVCFISAAVGFFVAAMCVAAERSDRGRD